MAGQLRDHRPRLARLPLNDEERTLLEVLLYRARFRPARKPRPATCVRCGRPTFRKLNDEFGVCPGCEPDYQP